MYRICFFIKKKKKKKKQKYPVHLCHKLDKLVSFFFYIFLWIGKTW